jgi:hypothetical protein
MKTQQNNKLTKVMKQQRRKRPQQQRRRMAMTRQMQAPVAVGSSTRAVISANTARVAVSGLVGSVPLKPETLPGTVLLELNLNPLTWEGNRIAHEAQLWQQFRFTNLKFTAKPAVPTICGGAYVHAVELEPEGEMIGGQDGVKYLASLPGSAYANVWSSSVATATLPANLRSQNWYRLDSEDAFHPDYSQGIYTIALAETFSGFTPGSVLSMSIWVEGTIEFSGRRLPKVATGSGIHTIPAGNWTVQSNVHGVTMRFGTFDWTWMVPDRIYAVLPETVVWTAPFIYAAFVVRKPNQDNDPYCYKSFVDAINSFNPSFSGDHGGDTDGRELALVDTGTNVNAVTSFRAGQPKAGRASTVNAGNRLSATGARPTTLATGNEAGGDSKPAKPVTGPVGATNGGHSGGDSSTSVIDHVVNTLLSDEYIPMLIRRVLDDALKSLGSCKSLPVLAPKPDQSVEKLAEQLAGLNLSEPMETQQPVPPKLPEGSGLGSYILPAVASVVVSKAKKNDDL